GPGRHARRVRLRPGARRALVRRRDRGGRPPRARVEARCARGRGGRPGRPLAARGAEGGDGGGGGGAGRSRVRRRGDAQTLKSLLAAARRLERALESLDGAIDAVEAPLRTRGEAGAERTAALGATLRQLGEEESSLRRVLAGAVDSAAAAERDLSRLGGTVPQTASE